MNLRQVAAALKAQGREQEALELESTYRQSTPAVRRALLAEWAGRLKCWGAMECEQCPEWFDCVIGENQIDTPPEAAV